MTTGAKLSKSILLTLANVIYSIAGIFPKYSFYTKEMIIRMPTIIELLRGL